MNSKKFELLIDALWIFAVVLVAIAASSQTAQAGMTEWEQTDLAIKREALEISKRSEARQVEAFEITKRTSAVQRCAAYNSYWGGMGSRGPENCTEIMSNSSALSGMAAGANGTKPSYCMANSTARECR